MGDAARRGEEVDPDQGMVGTGAANVGAAFFQGFGIHLAFAEMRSRLQDLTLRYGLFETLDRDHFHPTLETALAEVTRDETGPEPADGAAPA
jgi:hypothetical protein